MILTLPVLVMSARVTIILIANRYDAVSCSFCRGRYSITGPDVNTVLIAVRIPVNNKIKAQPRGFCTVVLEFIRDLAWPLIMFTVALFLGGPLRRDSTVYMYMHVFPLEH